jgi:mRNA interferase RelE/StbE
VDKYKVSFKPSALKELERLSPPWVDKIFLRIGNLQDDPRPAGCKKLKGGEAEWRIRIGDYRVMIATRGLKLLGSGIDVRSTTIKSSACCE